MRHSPNDALQVIDGRRNRAKRLFFQCLLFHTRDVWQRGACISPVTCSGTCYMLLQEKAAVLMRASQKWRLAGLDGVSPALRSLQSESADVQETIAVHLGGIMDDGRPWREPAGGEGRAPDPASASDSVPPPLHSDAIAGDEAACAYVLPRVIPGWVVSTRRAPNHEGLGPPCAMQEVPCAQNRCSTQE